MIDFQNKDKQIELNEKRLEEEYNRYHQMRSRIGILTLIYSLLSAYSFQLFKYAIPIKNVSIIYLIFLFVFVVFFIVSAFFTISFLWPREIAFKHLPKFFYSDLHAEYLKRGKKKEHIKYYIRESYLNELEKSIEHNWKLNNQISKFHFWGFTFALAALIPYLLCVGLKLSNEQDEIIKVKIITEQKAQVFEDINIKKENKMSEQETNPNNDQPQESTPEIEPTINPEDVIQVDPVMIKENSDNIETNDMNDE